MDSPFDLASLSQLVAAARKYLFQHVLSWAMVAQIATATGAILLAYTVTGVLRAWFIRQEEQCDSLSKSCADLTAADLSALKPCLPDRGA